MILKVLKWPLRVFIRGVDSIFSISYSVFEMDNTYRAK